MSCRPFIGLFFLMFTLDADLRADEKCEVDVVKDIAYLTGDKADAKKHKLDIYSPKGKKDCPVLFFVHGGAWKSGDRAQYPLLGKGFAEQGIVTVVISYRLSPGVQHPAHIQDTARAFGWVYDNVAKFGGRPDRIFVSGHSAGGHLVALLATNEEFLKAEGRATKDIRGVLPMSGVFTIFPGLMASTFGNDAAAIRNASPTHCAGPNLPPFLISYAASDIPTLGSMAEQLDKKLRDNKVDSTLMCVEGRNHITILMKMADANDPLRKAFSDFIARHSK